MVQLWNMFIINLLLPQNGVWHVQQFKENRWNSKYWSQVSYSPRLKMTFEETKTFKSYFSCPLSSLLCFWVVLEFQGFFYLLIPLTFLKRGSSLKKPSKSPRNGSKTTQETEKRWQRTTKVNTFYFLQKKYNDHYTIRVVVILTVYSFIHNSKKKKKFLLDSPLPSRGGTQVY